MLWQWRSCINMVHLLPHSTYTSYQFESKWHSVLKFTAPLWRTWTDLVHIMHYTDKQGNTWFQWYLPSFVCGRYSNLHKSHTRKCHHSCENTAAMYSGCAVIDYTEPVETWPIQGCVSADCYSHKKFFLSTLFSQIDILKSSVSFCESAKNLGVRF